MARRPVKRPAPTPEPKFKTISVRLPIEMVAWLEEQAKIATDSNDYGARTTLSDVVRQAVRLMQRRETA